MPIVESEFGPRSDPRLPARLAEAATSRWPVWLWSSDGSRILWANAFGTAIFGATPRCFDSKSAVGAQIIRLAATLPSAGPSRLERLRGFGAGFGRALTCACSRVVSADGTAAVLVVATEAAGQALPLAERLRRLFPGPARPVAAFAPRRRAGLCKPRGARTRWRSHHARCTRDRSDGASCPQVRPRQPRARPQA
jgi:hypothetical protein